MHRCLQIPELVNLIFVSAGANVSEAARLTTLASLARTCHAFHEPAMALIWRSMDNLTPLIKCMPADLWEAQTDGDDDPDEELFFKRHLTPSDCDPFNMLAGRVRVFNQVDEPFQGVSLEILRAFRHTWAGAPLLPNLHELSLDRLDDSELPFLELLFSPSIIRLRIPSIPETLALAARCHHNLRSLTIQVRCEELDLSRTICKFGRLVSFTLLGRSLLSPEAASHLASLTTLTVLDLDVHHKQKWKQSTNTSTDFGFLHLKDLRIRARLGVDLIGMLSMIRRRCLRSVALTAQVECTPGDLDRILGILGSHGNLRSLSLHIPPRQLMTRSNSSPPCGGFAVLQSLAHLQLTGICLAGWHAHMTVAEFRHIASWFPSLERLAIKPWGHGIVMGMKLGEGVYTPGIPLDVLVAILLSHRNLTHIGISVNADSAIPHIAPEELVQVVRCDVTDLDIGASLLNDVPMLAQFFFRLFPRLRIFHQTGVMLGEPILTRRGRQQQAAKIIRRIYNWQLERDRVEAGVVETLAVASLA